MEPTGKTVIGFGDADEKIEGGVGPWFLWYQPDAQDVRVRIADRDGRLVVEALHVEALPGVSLGSSDLRPLQLGRLQVVLNGPQAAELVREVLGRKGPASHRPGRARERRESWEQASERREEAFEAIRRGSEAADERRAELRRQAETRGRRPDEFYKKVAEEVASAAAWTRSPVAQVASDLEVTPSAVHRWIREARRRGLAAPGRATRRSELMAPYERAAQDEETTR